MESTAPCSICGCTETNLVDGFYYCTECGTQDTNVRETLVEFVTVGDGTFAMGSRKRITQIPKEKTVEMTDDWYKWHILNFLLVGLANELIAIGAEPTFKTKLLWIWTRYMKKFQDKADFGLETNDDSGDESADEKPQEEPIADDNGYSSDEDPRLDISPKQPTTVKTVSTNLIIALLYVALNIDRSPIQITHLLRFVKEGRISLIQWRHLIPKDMMAKKLKKCLLWDIQTQWRSMYIIRQISFQLFKELDLGNPLVPDMRQLVEQYLRDLSLPNDMKHLVFSIMHERSYEYLDINTRNSSKKAIPAYEMYALGHVLVALKIIYGLDDDYEVKISEAIDKINKVENHPKSYNSEPTDRLFSFKEWCDYIRFRKTLLRTHTLYLGQPHYFDMNDYVTFDQLKERQDYKLTLKDDITRDIVNKIDSVEVNVIPRSAFEPTFTPHTSYTRVIIDHLQDRKVKKLLSEDFTQYSLKFFMEDMFLGDPDSETPTNLLTGVSDDNKINLKKFINVMDVPFSIFPKEMVYVKNCDNHNWTLTQRPTLKHVTKAASEEMDEKDNDHGYVSNPDSIQNKLNGNMTVDNTVVNVAENTISDDCKTIDELSSTTCTEMKPDKYEQDYVDSSTSNTCETKSLENIKKDIEQFKIKEENPENNIFDDDFADLDAKEEINEPEEMELAPEDAAPVQVNESFNAYIRPGIVHYNNATQEYRDRSDSDESSVDSVRIRPETLDRTEAIKELIIHACNKYKVSLPGKYSHRIKPNRVLKAVIKKPKTRTYKGDIAIKINDLISSYHSQLKDDLFYQMSGMVQAAVADFNARKDDPAEPETNDEIPSDHNEPVIEELPVNVTNEVDTTMEIQSNLPAEKDDNKLFEDSSDGEINAEELLPKKNPEFDEKTHDINQLYIKSVDNESVPEITLKSKLFEIIDKATAADDDDSNKDNSAKDQSDSEDNLPLDVLQEQHRVRRHRTIQVRRNRSLKNLFSKTIPSYTYWFRQYSARLTAIPRFHQRFSNELDAKFPKSLGFILKECRDLVYGYETCNIYQSIQHIEISIRDKANRKRFINSYFEKAKKSKLNDFL